MAEAATHETKATAGATAPAKSVGNGAVKPTAKAAAPKVAKEPKPAKEVAAKAPKQVNGKPLTARITFGSDKDGKSFNGTDNNPKRRKAGERFAHYKHGMTVEAAVAAGVTLADVKWDLDKGFIKFAD